MSVNQALAGQELCANCHNPKSEHSIHDEFCLKVNNWSAQEFAESSTVSITSLDRSNEELPVVITAK